MNIIPDSMPHKLRCGLLLLSDKISSFYMKFYALWWGVKLGRKCSFCGVSRFRRTPSSKITIGDKCRFLSTFSSNLHGLNRPCMFSTVKKGAEINIGQGAGFSGTIVVAATSVEIGKRVFCGANTLITDTDSHPLDYRERNPAEFSLKREKLINSTGMAPIRIDDDVWLGMGSIVLKGVHIGRGTVVAAGSIVTKSLPDGVVAAGVPARVIRKLNLSDEKEQ